MSEKKPLLCEVTGNPCGTDTRPPNSPCPCFNCQRWAHLALKQAEERIAELEAQAAQDVHPFAPLPESLLRYVNEWLDKNELKSSAVQWSLFPIGMVQRWVEIGEQAEERADKAEAQVQEWRDKMQCRDTKAERRADKAEALLREMAAMMHNLLIGAVTFREARALVTKYYELYPPNNTKEQPDDSTNATTTDPSNA